MLVEYIFFNFRKEHENINNKVNAEIIEDKPFLPPIYNFVSSTTNLITWGEFSRVNFKSSKGLYSKKSVSVFFLIKIYFTALYVFETLMTWGNNQTVHFLKYFRRQKINCLNCNKT